MSSSDQSGGIGCLTVVGIVFVILKLCDVAPIATWSWLWVLAPFWIPFAIVGLVLLIVGLLEAGRR